MYRPIARSGSLPLPNSWKNGWRLVCHLSRIATIFLAMPFTKQLDLQRALHARARAELVAPALEVRRPRDELGERTLGAPVAGVKREIRDRELVAPGVLALGKQIVPHLEIALEAL